MTVNITGERRGTHALVAAVHRSLLDALRNELGLTGTKKGCEVGDCGSCTILLHGKPVNACLVLAAEVEGAIIETIEGLQNAPGAPKPAPGEFHGAWRSAVRLLHAGMLVMAKALLDEDPIEVRRKSALRWRQHLSMHWIHQDFSAIRAAAQQGKREHARRRMSANVRTRPHAARPANVDRQGGASSERTRWKR